jgi:periplasmic nitrate reductase NapD
MPDEIHISSFVVHAYPQALDAVAAAIAAMPGAELHARSPEGKLVVTLESASESAIVGCLERIGSLQGVLAATLVYHHWEPAEAPDA